MIEFSKYISRGAYHESWYYGPDKQPWYKELVDAVVWHCAGPTLDLCGGEGVVASLIAANGYPATCIDNDSVAVAMGKRLFPNVRFLEKDIATPTKGKWDYLACLNGIEHLENPGDILTILDKNIVKGGIIITDNAAHNHEPSKYHVKEYTIEELMQFFKDYSPEPLELAGGEFIGVKVFK